MVNLASTPQRTPQLHVCYLVRKPDESQKANDVNIRLPVVGTQSTQVVLVCRESCLRSSVTKAQNSKKQKQKQNRIKQRRATHPERHMWKRHQGPVQHAPRETTVRRNTNGTKQSDSDEDNREASKKKKVAKIWRLKRARPVGVHTRDAREQPSHAEQQASGPTEIETSWQFTDKCGTTRTSESPRPRREALG